MCTRTGPRCDQVVDILFRSLICERFRDRVILIEVYCNDNLLTELVLHEGLKELICYVNNIKKLNLPNSLTGVWCDKTVKGLEPFIDTDITIKLY